MTVSDHGLRGFATGSSTPRGIRYTVRLDIMENVVRAKFMQNPYLAARLVATGTMPLEEGNRWGDTFWGVDVRTGKGENNLGKILMKVRKELDGEYREA